MSMDGVTFLVTTVKKISFKYIFFALHHSRSTGFLTAGGLVCRCTQKLPNFKFQPPILNQSTKTFTD